MFNGMEYSKYNIYGDDYHYTNCDEYVQSIVVSYNYYNHCILLFVNITKYLYVVRQQLLKQSIYVML